jgi:hypothetical protein
VRLNPRAGPWYRSGMPLAPEIRRTRRAAAKQFQEQKAAVRRPCKNCDKKFIKIRPNHIFCSTECKNEYSRYGSAFGPLKQFLVKLIEKSAGERAAAAVAEQFAAYVTGKGFRRHLVDSGFVHRSMLRKRPVLLSATALRASIKALDLAMNDATQKLDERLQIQETRAAALLAQFPNTPLAPQPVTVGR